MKCPKCLEIIEEYYTKDYVRGTALHILRFDGKEADNSELYDCLSHEEGKVAYCLLCHGYIRKVKELES